MKKKWLALGLMGATIAGLVGCAVNKTTNNEPMKEEAEDNSEEMAKQDTNEEGSATHRAATEDQKKEKVITEENEADETKESSTEVESFVTYYGCPNSKRVAALNTKKNRIQHDGFIS